MPKLLVKADSDDSDDDADYVDDDVAFAASSAIAEAFTH